LSAFRKGGALVTFACNGLHPDLNLPEALAQHRFRTIENAASEEVSVGWCTPGDPTGDSFLLEDMDAGHATWLRMRIDQKKLPADWLAVHRAAAEKARGKRLSAREWRELKADLTEKLLPRVLPKMTFVDALLVPDDGKVLLLSSSGSAGEAFCKLFLETFGIVIEEQGPRTMGARLRPSLAQAIGKLEPTMWPGGNAGKSDESHGFLGEEFALWLWFQFEVKGGEFALPGGRNVGIAVDDLLAFAPGVVNEASQTMRRGMPTKAPASREALRQGHRLAQVRLLIAEGHLQWTATLDGASLSLGGVKLPEDAEDCESSEDLTADRAANWRALQTIVEGLFWHFLLARTDVVEWEEEAAAMAGWMAS